MPPLRYGSPYTGTPLDPSFDPMPEDDPETADYKAQLAALGQGPTLDTTQEPAYQQSTMQSILEGLSGLENAEGPAPRGFGGGLVSGFTRGLGRIGTKTRGERLKFQERAEKRQAERDEANRKATEEFRKSQSALTAKISGSQAKAEAARRGKEEELNRKSPILTPELKAQYPALANLPEGARVPEPVFTEAQKRLLPPTEAEKRAQKSADLALRNEQRRIDAQDRANRIAAAGTLNQLRDDYSKDKSIQAYTNVRSNIKTAEVARQQRNGTGDVALIFSYMRALEPDNPNVVREGDFKVARLAAGQLQRAASLPARFFKGDLLTEEGREHFLKQMRESLKARREDFDLANQQYRESAKDFDVNPARFVKEFEEGAAAPQPSAAPAAVGVYQPNGFFDANRPSRP